MGVPQFKDPFGYEDSLYNLRFPPFAGPCMASFRQSYWQRHIAYGIADRKTNARIKLYAEKVTMQVSNDSIFPTSDWEGEHGKKRAYDVPPKGQASDPLRSREESKRRARAKVTDIALCNKFQYMFTWTLDPSKVDRTDPEAVYKKVRAFLTNTTQRKGFTYVVIPEYHKRKPGEEKPGIHFHGLCNLGDVQIIRSMKRKHPRFDKHGRPVYNMSDWSLGWSTVVPLDENYEKAVHYITKYITKQDEKILGKYYLSSRSLKKSPDILPIDCGVELSEFVDADKLEDGSQHISTVYRDVVICSEDFDKDSFMRPGLLIGGPNET